MDIMEIWNWGLEEANAYVEDQREEAWAAEDRAVVMQTDLNWEGYDQAWDLQYDMNGGINALCTCGCGEPEPSAAFDDWEFGGYDHLKWLYRS